MNPLTFDVTAFRIEFPQFSDPTAFPDALLQGYWNRAICYISPYNYGDLNGACRQEALNLMTAHLAQLAITINGGQLTGQVQAATVDKVNVALTPPPEVNAWQWWLNQTGYGQELLALLQALAVGGFQSGFLPETGAFRRVGGIFI